MLSIGEFSSICKVSAKTLRYYAEIGLILPYKVNAENGYRYYQVEQLETMLFINRLKEYNFSLDEIKAFINSGETLEETLYLALKNKKLEIEKQIQDYHKNIEQIDTDLVNLKHGRSIMSYMDNIEVQLVEVDSMCILSIRKSLNENEIAKEYGQCFGQLYQHTIENNLTIIAPPMVLFHNDDFSPNGIDIEFAIPVKEYVRGTRDFKPRLCIKTVLKGPYTELVSVYARQCEWAEKEGYEANNALFEVYVTDPSQTMNPDELITEIYYPVKKKS